MKELASRERERLLGLLFGVVMALAIVYGAVVDRAPTAARVIAVLTGGVMLVLVVRWVILGRRVRRSRAPVGELSSDERLKARSKLKGGILQNPPLAFRK